jgi:DNA-binding response OmpR family regulator
MVELTVDEMRALEHARAHLCEDEMGAELVRDPAVRSAVSRLLGGTALTPAAWSFGIDAGGGAAVPPKAAAETVTQSLTLEGESLTVTICGERFVCKPISFRLLSRLIERRGQWIRTEALGREVLQAAFQQGASNVRWHVLQARRALGWRGGLLHSDNRLGFMFDFAACARRHCARPGPPHSGEGIEWPCLAK